MTPPRTPSVARLQRWLHDQRWYRHGDEPPTVASTTREALPTVPPLEIVLVTTTDGQRYQLVQCDAAPDCADQPAAAAALARFVAGQADPPPTTTKPAAKARTAVPASSTSAAAPASTAVSAHWVGRTPLGTTPARPLGADQSNTSVAVGGTHVLKVLRQLHPGVHPEVEVGRHLLASATAPVPALAGWYELASPDGPPTVLGVVHELVAGALDGWALVLSALAADPAGILPELRALGAAVAALHDALAQPGDGATTAFGAAPLPATEVWAMADALLADPLLPEHAHHVVARAVTSIGQDTGSAIRTHGDLHLGQTLVGAQGWMILDFEGEPSRTLEERTRHTSPLRDVAGMTRSLSYAAAAHRHAGGAPLTDGWEAAARAALLDGYLTHVDPVLLPTSAATVGRLLSLYELEKVLYEIGYERAHRPDWEPIPQAGLAAVLARADR